MIPRPALHGRRRRFPIAIAFPGWRPLRDVDRREIDIRRADGEDAGRHGDLSDIVKKGAGDPARQRDAPTRGAGDRQAWRRLPSGL
jgi:hypothetical protein